MLDLKGREIRTSYTKDEDGIEFKFGDKVMIRSDGMRIHSSSVCIQIDCSIALSLLREGDEVKFGENSEVTGEI
jgi:pyruvate kinase